MKGHFITDWSQPEQLTLREMPDVALTAGQVRVAVRAVGVNFADGLIIQGKYQEKPAFPFAPGFEIAGEVSEIAPDVTHFHIGQRVFAAIAHSGYADQVVLPASHLHTIPASMDFTTAAAFPIAYGTSHFVLIDRARLQAGETVLIHGAAGGVGLTAVECAKAAGAQVIATARGADRVQIALDHGADIGLDTASPDFSLRDQVRALTDGRGVDVVYDPVGGELFDASLRCTAPDGRLLVIGFAGGTVPQIPANHLLVKNLSVIGVYWGAYRTLAPARFQASFEQLISWYKAGLLRPLVSQTFPLEQASEALIALKNRQITGKAVLTVDPA